MLIYRIQHKRFKHGPYRHTVRSDWAVRSHATEKHPNYLEDSKLKRNLKKHKLLKKDEFDAHHLKFGFQSLKELCQWFNFHERKKLAKLGFELVSYYVPDKFVVKGNSQIMYFRKYARRKQILSWKHTIS